MSPVIANNNILSRKLQYLTLPIYTDIFIWNNSAGNLGNATTLKVNEAVRHDKSWHSANLYIPQEDNEAEGKAKCLWCTRAIYLWEWMPIYISLFLILKKGFQLSIFIIYTQVKGWRKIWASISIRLEHNSEIIPPWAVETRPWAKWQHITVQKCFSWWKICFKIMTSFTGFPLS